MTEERTCRCKGQFAMHKPALHADRDGSEGRAQLEREHERALAAYVPDDKADKVARSGLTIPEGPGRWMSKSELDELLAERDDLRARVEGALAVLDKWVIEAALAHSAWGEQVISVRHIDQRLGAILAARAEPEAAS